ncbi:hypothetical protein RHSIM_Rhsim07G0253600 [Rhododendron simsii]|uniref:Uncharacterized protein n=1 Tax=Rhododendron simsii TaxID=118357 RepID=A0A834GRT3_RHOSS|nr:hypothetical protein RHSIM_Rhsim07G0253600 [Rhododendron simsii]
MADVYCWDCERPTEVVFDHAACDTACSECGPVRLQNRCCDPDQSLISGFKNIATMCDRLGLVARIKVCYLLSINTYLSLAIENFDVHIFRVLLSHNFFSYDFIKKKWELLVLNLEICSVANGATLKEIRCAKRCVLQEYGMCHSVEMGTINASYALAHSLQSRTKHASSYSCRGSFSNI